MAKGSAHHIGLHGTEEFVVVVRTCGVVLDALLTCTRAGVSLKKRVTQGIQGEQHLTGVRCLGDLGDIGVPIPVGLKQVVPLVGLRGKALECGKLWGVAVHSVGTNFHFWGQRWCRLYIIA